MLSGSESVHCHHNPNWKAMNFMVRKVVALAVKARSRSAERSAAGVKRRRGEADVRSNVNQREERGFAGQRVGAAEPV